MPLAATWSPSPDPGKRGGAAAGERERRDGAAWERRRGRARGFGEREAGRCGKGGRPGSYSKNFLPSVLDLSTRQSFFFIVD